MSEQSGDVSLGPNWGDLVPPFEPCVNCTNGFVTTNGRHEMYSTPDGWFLKRCPCWHAHQRSILDTLQAQGRKKDQKD